MTARRAAIAVLLVAAALRLWGLGAVPPGFQFDEAHNAIDAARVLDGDLRIFFTDNGGREPLLTYLHAPFMAALGLDRAVLAMRLVSFLAGMATVALVGRAVADMFDDRRLGLLAAGFLAVSYWHVHFSRFAIRAILAPLWTTAALWAWWRAVGPAGDRPGAGAMAVAWRPAVACGALMAAAVYSHPSGRLLPLVLVGHALARVVVRHPRAAPTWRALAGAGITALGLFAPLGWYFWRHPTAFIGHPSDVSVLAVAEAQGIGVIGALARQVGAVAGMFFVSGDPSTFHNLPGLPVFDPLSALAGVLGAGIMLGAAIGPAGVRRDRAWLVGLWLAVMLLPTLLSDRPPNYSRAMAALPAIVLLPALGLRWTLATLPAGAARARPAIAAVVLVLAGLWTAGHYFVPFAGLDHLYTSYDMDKVIAWQALDEMSADAQVFLAPVWAEQATIAFLNRDGPVRTLDATGTLVFPGGADITAGRRPAGGRFSEADVVVAFPAKEAEREGWAARFEAAFGAVAERRDEPDSRGKPLLVTYRVSAGALGDLLPPTDAPLEPERWSEGPAFGGAIVLVGWSAGPARPGAPLPITLVWEARGTLEWDLTTFVQLVDGAGRAVGQEDREPGRASFRTSAWRVGDVIIDRFEPVLAADATGPVTVRLGWYDLSTGERLAVGARDALELGSIEMAR